MSDHVDERVRVRAALGCIPADDRALWVRIGMAIKAGLGEDGFELWDTWSQSSARYRAADARSTWRSIRPNGGITLGTLFFEASKRGYVQVRPESAQRDQASPPSRPEPELTTGGGEDLAPDQHCNSATLATYAAHKQLPEAFLRDLGLSDTRYRNEQAIRIPYADREGVEIAVRFRRYLEKGPSHDRRFAWRKGDKPRLYGLDRLESSAYVVLVEGESDCHTLWYHGLSALGIPGAASWNEERDASDLDGIERIYVVVEPDAGGEAVKRWIKRSRIQDRAYLVELQPCKDPSALHCADPEAFKARFDTALAAAVPVSDLIAAQDQQHAQQAWTDCREIAERPQILEAFEAAYAACGAVGDVRNAKLLYLALISRLLPRPVSVALKGPSSAGKSFAIETVLQFFPPEAVHCVTAISDRALAYTDAELKHRFLVIFEAAGMMGEFASYLIRSLLSEGRLIYELVERAPNGMRPRRIEKEGPTGLLVTTTAVRLHPENETRLLSLHVTDSRAQTKAVMRAIAAPQSVSFDPLPWTALQQWLEHAEHRVLIPYASLLAERIPPIAVRLRRDFSQLLSLIRAHAILHQATRERDLEGRIIATLEDYEVVRELVADLLAEGIGATVAPAVRETVEAVGALIAAGSAEVGVTQLAHALTLDKSAASRRASSAVQLGYLRNLEDRKGRPARLTLGEPLAESLQILPSAEVLHGCSVDRGDMAPLPQGATPARHGRLA